MRSVILTAMAVLAASPLALRAGPLLDAVNSSPGVRGPVSKAIALSRVDVPDNVEVFAVTTVTGDRVLLQFEQPPPAPKPKKARHIDLSSGPTRGPDVGCGSSRCGMCVINSLARHGQRFDYVQSLSHTERMRLHYKLHHEPEFAGVQGKTQTVGGGSRGGSRVRRLFGRRR